MAMDIEVIGMTYYTVHLTDEDTEKIKQFFEDRGEDASDCTKEEICNAVEELYSEGEIDLFDDDKYTESDFATDDIRWSEFERRTPDEIFNE